MIHKKRYLYLCILLCTGCFNKPSQEIKGVNGCSYFVKDGNHDYLVIETYGAYRADKTDIDHEIYRIFGDYSFEGDDPVITERRCQPKERVSRSTFEIGGIPPASEEQREELEKFLKTHEFTVEYREGMEEKKGKITFSYLDD